MNELDRLVQDPFRRREVSERGATAGRAETVVVQELPVRGGDDVPAAFGVEPTGSADEVALRRGGRVLQGALSALGRVVRRPAGEPLVAAVG